MAVMRVVLMAVQIPTDSETAASSGWLTNLAVMRVVLTARWYQSGLAKVVLMVVLMDYN